MDYSTLCRCCLKVLSHEDIESSSPWTMDKYTFCIQLQAHNEENLPKSFCRTCDSKIQSTYVFIKDAQACNQKLQNQISSNKEIKIEVDPDHGTNLLNSSLKDLLENPSSRFGSVQNGINVENQDFLTSKKHQRGRPKNTSIKKEIHKSKRKIVTKISKDIEKHLKKISKSDYSDSNDEDIQNIDDDDSEEDVELPNVPVNKKQSDSWVHTNQDSLLANIKTHDDFEDNITISEISKSLVTENRSISDQRPRSNNLQFTCPVCNKIFNQCPPFERHLKTHKTDTPTQAEVMELIRAKPHECNKCEQRFRFQARLKRHYASVHSDERPFACDSCDKSFKRKSNLRMHVRTHTSKDSREKLYKCGQCDKRFYEKKGLASHMFFHSGERPYTCDYCQKTYQTRQILRQHLNTHEGGHPFICDVCGKAFRDKYKLAEHMPKHTGERSFPCGHCSYRAPYRSSLTRHQRVVHKLTGNNNKSNSSPAVQ